MAASKDEPRSTTGRAENTEHSLGPASSNSANSQRDAAPPLRRDASSNASVPTLRKKPSSNLAPSAPVSASNSPHTSRNTSPIRPSLKQEISQTSTRVGLRSRKNSHDASPSRPSANTIPVPSVPSAAAIQRALSATNVPQMTPGPVTEAVSKLPRTSRPSTTSGETTPNTSQWQTAPRLKSPPPSTVNSRRNSAVSQRKSDPNSAPPIAIQHSTPTQSEAAKMDESAGDKEQLPVIPKPALRGPSAPKPTLETVEENTPPSTSILAQMDQTPTHRYVATHCYI